ncbi:hypothetical protein SAMN05880582_10781 [Rhizobium sp. RU20A]|uniref:hypothetical protein n=1 Tax=Rhizobium sp. RU20A TaxID=1907412 RepID=UPI000954BD58|nr:hypothetical protein [Rhizobium sp. RU20A]SIR16320.1 hypothetical protein SAMN05880582_10781 [Rhizobium sp. RU20A]
MAEAKISAVANDVAAAMDDKNMDRRTADLEAQIAELKAELSNLASTVGNIGQATGAVVKGEAERVTDDLRERVRSEPLGALAAVAGISFVLGLMARR